MTAKVSLCKHSFPIQPPHGSIVRPGDCTGCGVTWNAIQAELAQQLAQREVDLCNRTAHEGRCTSCALPRMVFRYQREAHPWEPEDPPAHWLCTTCWGNAQATEEATGFTDLHDAFNNATDDQLARFVFGGAQ